jgi:ERCC4-type nuclease
MPSTTAVPPTKSRLIVKRDGKMITSKVPRPVVLIDTREQAPFDFTAYNNWIAGQSVATLPTGDYTVLGMESVMALERKSLNDLVSTLMHNRERFIRACERLAELRYKAILIEATWEDVKSPYTFWKGVTAHPNGVAGSIEAIAARWQIQILYSSQHRALSTEMAAGWLSKHATYHWLEENGYGRVLQEGDL